MGTRALSRNSLQAFHKRFSGPIRALPPEPAGADAWRATTYGHGVLQTNPLGSALDQESPGSSPGGATGKPLGLGRRLSSLLLLRLSALVRLRRRAQEGQLEARCDD